MSPKTRDVLAYTAMAVFTIVISLGSVWPFMNGWLLREKPEFLVAHDWMIHSKAMDELVGGHRATESDWFPKGGSDGQTARYEFKITGDLTKQKVSVIVKESGGTWAVSRAAYEKDGEWVELAVD
jgi:hypothetical protein